MESHIITKVAGLKGTRFADTIATLWACWVFLRVHKVTTFPDLVGPVGFEPTTKGL